MDAATDLNQRIVDEFRANHGRVGGHFAGATLILLTTTGAKSGKRSVSPVMTTVEGDHLLIYASNAGKPSHPAWYHNVVANPDVTVELGAETFPARATVVAGAERDRLWDEQVTRAPGFGDYQRNSDRVIPVVAIDRT